MQDNSDGALVLAQHQQISDRELPGQAGEPKTSNIALPIQNYDQFLHESEALDAALKSFFNEIKSVDRDNEVNRILWSFKLNPYEKLNLEFTAIEEEIRKQYRKLSLMVHPDKCVHEKASDAFEILKQAQVELLDPEMRGNVDRVLGMAKEEVLAEWRKSVKHDGAIRVEKQLNVEGSAGVQQKYEQSKAFKEAWKKKGREFLARTEFRKRKIVQRIADEEQRVKDEIADEKLVNTQLRDHKQNWEDKREERVGGWRDFLKGGEKKKKKKIKGIKPPKMKTHDEDKLYVQRSTLQQQRPNDWGPS
eukprot:TRINITY_DN24567_c0_g1_i3.p1 TRINITY_DN24567_c0_g1~~TRINITY_DN24567_c0_g1_i3.p1  ORF type:complete len:305 (-),score=72.36 TRINITY_DN24567_c0_g1_i3:224-1138(-)